MDIRQIIAALPLLRKLWKWLPGPLRLIVVGIAVVIGIKRLFFDSDEAKTGEQEALNELESGSGGGSGDGSGSGDEAA
jgi:hypothetical protein